MVALVVISWGMLDHTMFLQRLVLLWEMFCISHVLLTHPNGLQFAWGGLHHSYSSLLICSFRFWNKTCRQLFACATETIIANTEHC